MEQSIISSRQELESQLIYAIEEYYNCLGITIKPKITIRQTISKNKILVNFSMTLTQDVYPISFIKQFDLEEGYEDKVEEYVISELESRMVELTTWLTWQVQDQPMQIVAYNRYF